MQGANWHKLLLSLAMSILGSYSWGQDVRATLTSREKQVQIGRPFEIELSVRHPERTIVIFPDTIKDFLPYEVKTGKPIPTSTNEGVSEDVKIYKLYTWEIDSIQKLQFPVRFVNAKGDTDRVVSNAIMVELLPMIAAFSDTLKVREVEGLAAIREPINWVAWGIITTVLLLLVLIGVVVFSKPIRKWLLRAKIEREWRRYLGQLSSLRESGQNQDVYYPGLNKIWRSYFDRDWYLALGSMTTSELQQILPNIQVLDDEDRRFLAHLSSTTDMVLYAGRFQSEEQAYQFGTELQRIMAKEYKRRKEAAEI